MTGTASRPYLFGKIRETREFDQIGGPVRDDAMFVVLIFSPSRCYIASIYILKRVKSDLEMARCMRVIGIYVGLVNI